MSSRAFIPKAQGSVLVADQESIDIVMAYILRRLSLMPWLRAEISEHTEHNNQIEVRQSRVDIRTASYDWIHAGFIIADWMDPADICYKGPYGEKKFDIHDPNVLDKIVRFLADKICPTF
jgi:hypothetical protein